MVKREIAVFREGYHDGSHHPRTNRYCRSLASAGGYPWGVATFNLKTPERGHHRLFLSQYPQNGGGNSHDNRSGRICAHL